ncbi:hypothetical protein N7476_000277 [Penicillium atrosanguineum]|uniref:Uncharacterized protein n=1 Tax=Penicillium atrosanguineum TaxID=1132637 RepID=A0A9W9QB64_9EURO|nr:hypothetical protein N7476_000277 [Penicillium atrosanguineum]
MWPLLKSRRAGSGKAGDGYCKTACGQHWYSISHPEFAMLSHEIVSNAMMDLTYKYMQTSEGIVQAVDGEKTQIRCDGQTRYVSDTNYIPGSVVWNGRPQFKRHQTVKTYPHMASFVRHAHLKWQYRRVQVLYSQKRLFHKDKRKVLSEQSLNRIGEFITDWDVPFERVLLLSDSIASEVVYIQYNGQRP